MLEKCVDLVVGVVANILVMLLWGVSVAVFFMVVGVLGIIHGGNIIHFVVAAVHLAVGVGGLSGLVWVAIRMGRKPRAFG